MKVLRRFIAGAVLGLGLLGAAAQAGPYGWSVGVRFGYPGCYRPYGGFGYGCGYYYWPRPLYLVPPPAVVVGAPPPPVVVPAYSSPVPPSAEDGSLLPPPTPLPPPAPSATPPPPPTPSVQSWPPQSVQHLESNPTVQPLRSLEDRRALLDGYLRALADRDERVRLDSVTQLGRMKAVRAIDPLAATLAGDPSSTVRDAAAKALGLIGAPGALPALNRAAQLDPSNDVRRTARFAVEIIQAK